MQLYYPSLTLNINEPFPIENPYPGKEGPILATHAEGMHLILFSNHIAEDRPVWANKTLGLGLTDFDNIPFLVLTFQHSPLTLLYTLNVYGIIGDERGPWLRSTTTEIKLLLVDNATGKLACVRTLVTNLLTQLRQIGYRQWKQYSNGEQVDIQVRQLFNSPQGVTAQQIYNQAQQSNQLVIQHPTHKTDKE